MRTLVDLPEDDLKWLDTIAAKRGKSRASVVREAVAAYRAQAKPADDMGWLDNAFGIWKDRADVDDAVEWQRRERASWTRTWDDDYETVKAEFPDLLDEQDDRERAWYLELRRKATVYSEAVEPRKAS